MLFIVFVLIGVTLPIAGEGRATNALRVSAVAAGPMANAGFILYNRMRILSRNFSNQQIVKQLQLMYKPLLNAHILLNVIGYFASMTHGLLYSRYIEPISLSLVFIMSALTSSGLQRYSAARDVKIANKPLHGQWMLSATLIMLLTLHFMIA
ncbi:MAG: hypothetical protein QW064_06150 [Candidatus Caldarchaeum sp.]